MIRTSYATGNLVLESCLFSEYCDPSETKVFRGFSQGLGLHKYYIDVNRLVGTGLASIYKGLGLKKDVYPSGFHLDISDLLICLIYSYIR